MKKRNRIRQRGRKRDKVLQARLRAKRGSVALAKAPTTLRHMELPSEFFTMDRIKKALNKLLARAK